MEFLSENIKDLSLFTVFSTIIAIYIFIKMYIILTKQSRGIKKLEKRLVRATNSSNLIAIMQDIIGLRDVTKRFPEIAQRDSKFYDFYSNVSIAIRDLIKNSIVSVTDIKSLQQYECFNEMQSLENYFRQMITSQSNIMSDPFINFKEKKYKILQNEVKDPFLLKILSGINFYQIYRVSKHDNETFINMSVEIDKRLILKIDESVKEGLAGINGLLRIFTEAISDESAETAGYAIYNTLFDALKKENVQEILKNIDQVLKIMLCRQNKINGGSVFKIKILHDELLLERARCVFKIKTLNNQGWPETLSSEEINYEKIVKYYDDMFLIESKFKLLANFYNVGYYLIPLQLYQIEPPVATTNNTEQELFKIFTGEKYLAKTNLIFQDAFEINKKLSD
jgi:hypothetical protein